MVYVEKIMECVNYLEKSEAFKWKIFTMFFIHVNSRIPHKLGFKKNLKYALKSLSFVYFVNILVNFLVKILKSITYIINYRTTYFISNALWLIKKTIALTGELLLLYILSLCKQNFIL